MTENEKNKILHLDDLLLKVKELKEKGKTIVQTHGVFDLIHPGHIKHINSAKNEGDILIATIIKDDDVRRGPGRPVFPDTLRAENVASLEQVDFVAIVDDYPPFACVKLINPNVFAKGKTHGSGNKKTDEKIFELEKSLYLEKGRIHETDGIAFSSTSIINNFLDIYPEGTKTFLERFAKKHSFQSVLDTLNSLKDLKVLLVGDGILDEYHYCESMGKSAKAHLVVSRFLNSEAFNGGAFAIANHIAGFCDEVSLISLLGKEDSKKEFITDNLKPNIKTRFFFRDDGPTIIKKRYVNQYLNQKLFEINYLNDEFIDKDLENKIIRHLKSVIPDYDMVLISDFGHGFITPAIIEAIEESSKFLAVNTQTNGANRGFNLITKYSAANFLCLDEPEVRLATQERATEIELVAKRLLNEMNNEHLIVTLGKKGSISVTKNGETVRTPIFSSKVIDTVGAGDAFFAYTAPCFAKGVPAEVISFIGNAVGALAVQIIGNKTSVEKYSLVEFIKRILK